MSIELLHLTKRYGPHAVVDDVSLAISTGELFVLLGPSGSGKSTLLRMIAGLAAVDSGSVHLHGHDVTATSAKDRDIGFVFQHYALFRHMTVADNVEFALRIRRVPRRQRQQRREDLLQLVGLAGLAGRYPRQLSGGQQQRVALARALAHEPRVLLLDEPFGALDARIRVDLRQALRRIQQQLGLTTVFVTHDQEEAFELADRLAVLHEGRLLEAGEPRELYLRPRSPFVATFLGAANLFVGESSARSVRLGAVELPVSSEVAIGRAPRRVQIVFRPEDVELSDQPEGKHPRLGLATVEHRAFVGAGERLRVTLPPLPGVRAVAPAPPFGTTRLAVDVVRPQHEALATPLGVGSQAWLAVRRFHVLAPASLRLLLDHGAGPAATAARTLGEAVAERIGAQLERLGVPPEAGAASALGGETEEASEGFDIAVLGLEPSRLPAQLGNFAALRHHLLLVAGPAAVPTNLLVCVAVGEPGKGDVRFAERLAWQLGARAKVLTVLTDSSADEPVPAHVVRFLDACERALTARGVVGSVAVRYGDVDEAIAAELAEGGHDLLVLGAPQGPPGRPRLDSVVERVLRNPPPQPILVVRGHSG